jgi:hypothetical protein
MVFEFFAEGHVRLREKSPPMAATHLPVLSDRLVVSQDISTPHWLQGQEIQVITVRLDLLYQLVPLSLTDRQALWPQQQGLTQRIFVAAAAAVVETAYVRAVQVGISVLQQQIGEGQISLRY